MYMVVVLMMVLMVVGGDFGGWVYSVLAAPTAQL